MRTFLTLIFLFFSTTALSETFEEGLDAYNKGDYNLAFDILITHAEEGHLQSQIIIAEMYSNGEGTNKNSGAAQYWKEQVFYTYKSYADEGNAAGQYLVGEKYYTGDGVEKDMNQAIKYTRLSAEQGFAKAQYNLGTFYYFGEGVEQDLEKAFELILLSAEQGFATAQYGVGNMIYFGEGVPQDEFRGVEWIELAANQGFFTEGPLVKDYDKSFKWFRLGALKGHAQSQYFLGRMFFSGHGTEVNREEAYKWNYLAKANGLHNKDTVFNDEKLEEELSKSKVKEIQKLAIECINNNYEGC